MNYHETVPSEPGLYLIDGTEALMFHSDGKWYGHAAREVFDVERFTPMLGPLPTREEGFLSMACEVAFARMMLLRWDRTEHDSQAFENCRSDMRDGNRSIELLRDMERVTAELGAKP
jgi:hypothetical protein